MPDAPVLVNKEEGEVAFILRPNQTFSSFVMRALEGKVLPVSFQTIPKAGKVYEPKVDVNSGADSDAGLDDSMKTVDTQSKEPK